NKDFAGEPSSNNSTWSNIRGLLGFNSKPNGSSKTSNSNDVPVTSASSPVAQDLVEAERLSDYVDELQTSLKVEPVKEARLTVRETRLIDISYRHTDPHLAAKIVNSVAETFVDQNLEKKIASSST